MRRFIVFAAGVALFAAAGSTGQAQPAAAGGHPDIRLFFQAIHDDDDVADVALEQIAARWRNGYAGIIWDLVRFMQPPRRPAAPRFGGAPTNPGAGGRLEWIQPEHPSTRVWRRLMRFLEQQTGQRFRGDIRRAHRAHM